MPRMKQTVRIIFFSSTMLSTLFIAGCQGGMPQMFWSADDGKPDYAHSQGRHTRGDSRAPLDVPPELRHDLEVPMADKVAVDPVKGDKTVRSIVAGKSVALNTRTYPRSTAQIFSATVDAMTALNMPVQSVDSPSGIITTDWIRPNSNSQNSYAGALTSMIGAGPVHLRYRFVVRVLRAGNGNTALQIRTLGQQYINSHWVSKQVKKKVNLELFSAVEDQLASLKPATSKPASIDQAR
jgi:hypothetical protein